MDNKVWSYDIVSKLLHWMLAALLIFLVGLGWYMTSIEDQPGSGSYFNLHKSLGLIAASLIFLRLIWRFLHKPAPLPANVPQWQAKLSKLIHFLLYICMIAMPLTGYLGASLSGDGVALFGYQLPDWAAKNHNLSEEFFEIHETVVWVLVVLVVLHALAAIKHLFINKDGVFQRMWF